MRATSFCRAIVVALIASIVAQAEPNILLLSVSNTRNRPIQGVVLSPKGAGSTSAPTDVAGRTRIKVASQTQPGDWVSLMIVSARSGQQLVFISPWDGRVMVPRFESEAENFAPVVLGKRGDRKILESGSGIVAVAANIEFELAPKSVNKKTSDEDRHLALASVSEKYGFRPSEVDAAIRAFAQKAKDAYDSGLVELYAGNYSEASKNLSDSLKQRESEMKKEQSKVADIAFFLGQSLYAQGRYVEAAEATRKALALRRDDPEILTQLGLALNRAGDRIGAEPILQEALATLEKSRGPEHPDVATALNNLASVYLIEARYADAEPLLKRALTIHDKTLAPDHPDLATDLDNLALLYQKQGRYGEAEPLNERALAIFQKSRGPQHTDVAVSMNNLARLYHFQGRYDEAERLFRQALTILEEVAGPGHPNVAKALDNLAALYEDEGRYSEAEPLLRRALAIQEEALPSDHPDVAASLVGLATLYDHQGKYSEAESLFKRALAIREKTQGPDHPDVAGSLVGLATLYDHQGKYSEAEALVNRALAIRGEL